MRRSILPVLLLASVVWPSRARAESGLEVDARYVRTQLDLRGLSFRGARGAAIDARAFGMGDLTLHGGELAFLGRGGLFTFGPAIGISGSAASGGTGPAAWDGITMLRAAFEAHAHQQLGSWLVDASVGAGGRFFFLGRSASMGDCPAAATATSSTACSRTASTWSIVPRLEVAYQPGLGAAKEALLGTAIGAFVGTDVLRPGSVEAGLSLAFRLWIVPPGKTWSEMMKRWETERAAKNRAF